MHLRRMVSEYLSASKGMDDAFSNASPIHMMTCRVMEEWENARSDTPTCGVKNLEWKQAHRQSYAIMWNYKVGWAGKTRLGGPAHQS